MLSTTAADQHEEIEAAMEFQALHVGPALRLIRQGTGADYREDWKPPDGPNFQNHESEFLSNMVPSLVDTNPRVETEGTLPGVDDVSAEAIETGVNQWIEAVDYSAKMADVASDTCFGWGCTISTLQITPGFEQEPEPLPMFPWFERLSFTRFYQDPQGGRHNWRYRGHMLIADKSDLLSAVDPYTNEPMFDRAAVESLPPDVGVADKLGFTEAQKLVVERGQVMFYEHFVRESQMIYTLAVDRQGGGAWLRKPRPWRGRKNGPYTVFGFYWPTDQVYPQSPLSVTAEKVRDINRHRLKISQDAEAAKNLIVVDASNNQLRRKIETSLNNTVISVPNLMKESVIQMQFGGVQPANVEYVAGAREELYQTSGLSDLKRGNISGKATATEVSEVAQSDNARTAYMRTRFRESQTEQLNKVAFQMIKYPDVKFPIVVTRQVPDPMTGQPVEVKEAGWFHGGIQEGEDPGLADRLRVRIEPYSGEFVDSGTKQRRAVQVFEMVMQTAPLIPQMPWMKWKNLYDDTGESINVKGMFERYVDQSMLMQIQMQQQMAQQQAMMQGGQPGQQPGQQGQPQQGPKQVQNTAPNEGRGAPQLPPAGGMEEDAAELAAVAQGV